MRHNGCPGAYKVIAGLRGTSPLAHPDFTQALSACLCSCKMPRLAWLGSVVRVWTAPHCPETRAQLILMLRALRGEFPGLFLH